MVALHLSNHLFFNGTISLPAGTCDFVHFPTIKGVSNRGNQLKPQKKSRTNTDSSSCLR